MSFYTPHFKNLGIHLRHLETRPSRTSVGDGKLDYYLELQSPSEEASRTLLARLETITSKLALPPEASVSSSDEAWFPRHISELHRCCTTLFKYGHELAPDHPGYGDVQYEKRRREISEVAKNYR